MLLVQLRVGWVQRSGGEARGEPARVRQLGPLIHTDPEYQRAHAIGVTPSESGDFESSLRHPGDHGGPVGEGFDERCEIINNEIDVKPVRRGSDVP